MVLAESTPCTRRRVGARARGRLGRAGPRRGPVPLDASKGLQVPLEEVWLSWRIRTAPQGVIDKGMVDQAGFRAIPQGAQAGRVHRLVLCLLLPWLAMRARGDGRAGGGPLAWHWQWIEGRPA